MADIVVIGAGIIGLSSAINIQRRLPGSRVTVVAERFNDLTSHIAAGLFRPTLELMQGVAPDIARLWVVESWKHFDGLAMSSEASLAGISPLSGYHLWDEGKAFTRGPNIVEEFSYHFKMLTPNELAKFPGHRFQHGCFFTTIQIESVIYMDWLMMQFLKNGGKTIKKRINDYRELCGSCDVVVNCTGLQAGSLQVDPLLKPNRGQMFRFKAPWIRHFCFTNHNTWIIPCSNSVVVGGTRQQGDSTTDVREEESESMWSRACDVQPSLQKVKEKSVVVGLRPTRYPIRVERETLHFDKQQLKVVHNYGHGGNGIALSWGTAVNTAQLVLDAINPHKSNPVKSKY